MNIAGIRVTILKFFKEAWVKFKETLTLPYAKIYIIFSVVMVVFFIIATFPYDILIRNQLKSLEKNAVDSVFVGEIEFNFIDVISINNLMIIFKSGEEVSIKDIIIDGTTNPYSLLVSNNYKGGIQLTGIKYSSAKAGISMNMNTNFSIVIDKNTGIPIDGVIRSFIIQNASISFPDNALPSPLGFIKLERPMVINSINADAVIKNRTLTLNGFKVFGNDIRGDISGTVQFERISGNSRLNLKIAIDPESAILSEFKELLVSFISDGKILLLVDGTLANPSLRTGGSSSNPASSSVKSK
jgi:hypothetical protein